MQTWMIVAIAVVFTLAVLRKVRRFRHYRRMMHGGRQWWLKRLARRIKATPEQQQVLTSVAAELDAAVRPLRAEFWQARRDLATALASQTDEPSLLSAAFDRQEAALKALRAAIESQVAQLRQSLQPQQRQQLAVLISGGHRRHC